MKPQVTFQKCINGRVYRVVKHKTVTRVQVLINAYFVNADMYTAPELTIRRKEYQPLLDAFVLAQP